jgi:hypothetical protein
MAGSDDFKKVAEVLPAFNPRLNRVEHGLLVASEALSPSPCM